MLVVVSPSDSGVVTTAKLTRRLRVLLMQAGATGKMQGARDPAACTPAGRARMGPGELRTRSEAPGVQDPYLPGGGPCP